MAGWRQPPPNAEIYDSNTLVVIRSGGRYGTGKNLSWALLNANLPFLIGAIDVAALPSDELEDGAPTIPPDDDENEEGANVALCGVDGCD